MLTSLSRDLVEGSRANALNQRMDSVGRIFALMNPRMDSRPATSLLVASVKRESQVATDGGSSGGK
jgi:hypothetical protein